MIISKTPYRISFFGGGTDFAEWFKEYGGAVISVTIDKYCYLTVRPLPPFFEHQHRIVYSEIELVKKIGEIKHASVRECLQLLEFKEGLEIHHDGDLPARSGLGSSSSFTVGLLNALYAYRGRHISKKELAAQSIYVERNLIKEVGGHQDQIATSFGGFNKITFSQGAGNEFSVQPMLIHASIKKELEKGLVLFFTGKSRTAELIEKSKIEQIKNKTYELQMLASLLKEGEILLNSRSFNLSAFGKLLDESWKMKQHLSKDVSNTELDQIYSQGLKAGAYGGKLLGAGGGGFILFCVEPYLRLKLIDAMYPLTHVPFKFEYEGSHICLYSP